MKLGISGRYVPGERTPPTLNLAAWARGEEEHIWPEVKRAINWYLLRLGVDFVDFKERHEAVDWLIAEGFIEKSEARQDVYGDVIGDLLRRLREPGKDAP
jgi:hypothetical protein